MQRAKASHPPLISVISWEKELIRERVVVLWGVLTASTRLPPTAEEALMEEDFQRESKKKKSGVEVKMSRMFL